MTTFPTSHRDLLDAQIGHSATIGANGIPELTAVWFLYDDDDHVKIWLNTAGRAPNLAQRPSAACSSSTLNPFRYLDVRGRATLTPTPTTCLPRSSERSTAVPISASATDPGESRVVVTIEPDNVYAVDMSA